MTLKQKIVVVGGVTLTILALLFPPSTTVQASRTVGKSLGFDVSSGVITVSTEFHFLDYENTSYDMLTAELFIIGLTTGLLIYAFRRQKAA